MNNYILFALLILFALPSKAQEGYEVGIRLGNSINKMNIDETDEGFFYLGQEELLPFYEIFIKKSFQNFDVEIGLSHLVISQLLSSKFENNNINFPVISASGEEFNYVGFPIRIKKEFNINSWIGFAPGVELASAYLFHTMIFSTDSRSCFVLNNTIRSCTNLKLHESAQFTTGLGINAELNFKIFNKIALGIFGSRNWRIGKGWTVDVTKEYEDALGNIIATRRGTGRPSLSTWNMGMKISFLW